MHRGDQIAVFSYLMEVCRDERARLSSEMHKGKKKGKRYSKGNNHYRYKKLNYNDIYRTLKHVPK